MKNKIVNHFIGILGIVLSIAVVWFIIDKYDIKQSLNIIKKTPISSFVIMIIIYLSTFYFRALRWKFMLADIDVFKLRFLLKSIILGFAGNNLIPARGGELLRMEFFSRKTKISRTTSLTSIVLEKILDALILLAFLICAGFMLDEINDILLNTIKIASFIFLPITILLISIRIKGDKIIRWIGQRSSKVFLLLTNLISKFYAALTFMKTDINTLKILGLSVLIWSLEGLVFVIGIKAIGINDSTILVGIIALCFVNFGILIPSSPGYIGIFQAALIISLSLFSISSEESLAAAIIIHSCQFFPITILGLIIIFTNYFKPFNKKLA